MKPLVKKIKPSRGYSHLVYVLFNASLPLLVLLSVKSSFSWIGALLIVLSKWRMFAVRPRFWGANIRANAIDIIVGFSALGCMVEAESDWYRLTFVVLWALWLIFLKPKTSILSVSLQALVGYTAGLMTIFLLWSDAPLIVLVSTVGLVCYFAAHHFFYSFDEPHRGLLAYLWAYFGSALTWILGHWLVFYWFIAQPTVLLVALAVVFGTLYYLDHFDRLTAYVKRQIIFIGAATVLIIWMALAYYHWLHGGTIIV
jgi:hypothetical protein